MVNGVENQDLLELRDGLEAGSWSRAYLLRCISGVKGCSVEVAGSWLGLLLLNGLVEESEDRLVVV